jgi:hydrogenase maturation protein HypF
MGDLSTVEASTQFEQTVTDVLALHAFTPQAIACDEHPDYRSTRFARMLAERDQLPLLPVQHHHAHIAACMAEQKLTGPVLGIAWDGAGYGQDATVWGGEFFLCQDAACTRVGTVRPFSLPGGDICMREPRRVALSLLSDVFEEKLFDLQLPPLQSLGPEMARLCLQMIQQGINAPMTSSIGRLFDGVSALLSLFQLTSFEGQAAMGLEFLAEAASPSTQSLSYRLPIHPSSPSLEGFVVDWRPMIKEIVQDYRQEKNSGEIAWGFHQALAHLIADMAQRLACPQVVLSGGVFQNALLLSLTKQILTSKGMQAFVAYLFGPHDGGLSIGQGIVARHLLRNRQKAESLTTTNRPHDVVTAMKSS